MWALSGGRIPLALTVLQVLALDIGTDLLPALALGAEPPNRRTMQGRRHLGALVDRTVVRRAFGVLGPAEACLAMAGFLVVLVAGGWRPGGPATPGLLAAASGVCFSAIVLGQLANAFACRSESSAVGRVRAGHNPLLTAAVGVALALLVVFLSVPPLPELLGGRLPDAGGWALAALAVPAVLVADAADKELRARRARRARPTPRPPWAIAPAHGARPGHGLAPGSLP